MYRNVSRKYHPQNGHGILLMSIGWRSFVATVGRSAKKFLDRNIITPYLTGPTIEDVPLPKI